jgi:hypothetical protein
MSRIPVIAHHVPRLAPADVERAERLADRLLREQPELAAPGRFRPLLSDRLEDAPTLHLDDMSAIALLDRFYDIRFLGDRARVRAGDGDCLVSCASRADGYEEYCGRLGLGSVTVLRPESSRDLGVAAACWKERLVRSKLQEAMRHDGLRYVHPHMGTDLVWAVAWLLHRSTRRPLHVIAPPPVLSRRVNHKLWFTDVVGRLFGDDAIPHTEWASDHATLATIVRRLSGSSRRIVVKVPDSAGGAGNLVLESDVFRHLSLTAIQDSLEAGLNDLKWFGQSRLLVGCWETDVLHTPSVQLWIPPMALGPPVVEGVFEQILEGPQGFFVGNLPASLPDEITVELADRAWLIGKLFQRLGYVGRCSFDLILVGEDLDACRVEFVECNGRWGGTSLPMTLMNRLFGDWQTRPYAFRECSAPGLERIGFPELIDHFRDEMFDPATGQGRWIFLNPSSLPTPHGIDVIALCESWEGAAEAVSREMPARLAEMVGTRAHLAVDPQTGTRSQWKSDLTASTLPSGTSSHSSDVIGSDATTSAR